MTPGYGTTMPLQSLSRHATQSYSRTTPHQELQGHDMPLHATPQLYYYMVRQATPGPATTQHATAFCTALHNTASYSKQLHNRPSHVTPSYGTTTPYHASTCHGKPLHTTALHRRATHAMPSYVTVRYTTTTTLHDMHHQDIPPCHTTPGPNTTRHTIAHHAKPGKSPI